MSWPQPTRWALATRKFHDHVLGAVAMSQLRFARNRGFPSGTLPTEYRNNSHYLVHKQFIKYSRLPSAPRSFSESRAGPSDDQDRQTLMSEEISFLQKWAPRLPNKPQSDRWSWSSWIAAAEARGSASEGRPNSGGTCRSPASLPITRTSLSPQSARRSRSHVSSRQTQTSQPKHKSRPMTLFQTRTSYTIPTYVYD